MPGRATSPPFTSRMVRATWRAGLEARSGHAMLIALIGGGAAIVAAGCLAGALILFQLGGATS